MKKAFLILLTIGIYVLVNLIAIYHISSYGYMLSLFKSSNHYQMVKQYQDKWDVPIWVGEFCWERQVTWQTILIQPWLRLTGFEYMAEESMIRIFDDEGWSWSRWEYQKGAYEDEMENALLSKYMKDIWKPSDPIPKLVVRGKQIQTEDGEPVVLTGGNLPLRYLAFYSTLETTEETFQKLDETGMNSLRIIMDLDSMIPQEGKWNQKSFDTLKQALDLAEKHHIYVIIGIHQYRGSSYFRSGNGFPPWYVQRYTFGKDDWEEFDKMWTEKQPPFEDSWEFVVEAWKKIIEVSRGRNIVIGYDLFNEPPGQPHKFYEYLSAQIEPLDPGKIHFAETMYLFRGMDGEDKPEINNLVLAPHIYDIWKPNFFMVMFVTSTLLLVAVIIFSIVLIAPEKMKFLVRLLRG